MKLTDPMVRAAKPREKPYELPDADPPGLRLRVSTKGTKSWTLVYRPRGSLKQQRVSLGRYPSLSLKSARDDAKDVLALVRQGRNPAQERKAARMPAPEAAPRRTFADLVARYGQAKRREGKRSIKEDERIFNKYVADWHARSLDEITRADVRSALAHLVHTDRPTMANRTFQALHGLFNFALREELVSINPCAGLTKPAPDRQRDRVLSRDELRRFWRAVEHEDAHVAALFKLALLTGQRGYEIRTMTWDATDGDKWTIPSERTKNGQAHRVPLSRQARVILEALPRVDGSPFVFPGPGRHGYRDQVTKAVKRVRALAAVDFWFHDLRRTCATYLAGDLDVSQELIGRLLNHSDGSVTAVYNRAGYDTQKAKALQRWADHLDRILAEQDEAPAKVVPLRA